jgi:hypothetical protein
MDSVRDYIVLLLMSILIIQVVSLYILSAKIGELQDEMETCCICNGSTENE